MNIPIPNLIILGCWIIFLIYWFVSSLFVKATAERKSFGSSLSYRILFIVGWITIIKIQMPDPWNLRLTPNTPLTGSIAAAVCVLGLFICLWSRWTLAGNWSSNVQFKEGHELVKAGPYRFVRHPIYTGILLMLSAPGIQYGRLHHWAGLAIMCAGLWIKLKQEEAIMLRHSPEYSDYRKKVKALIPYLL